MRFSQLAVPGAALAVCAVLAALAAPPATAGAPPAAPGVRTVPLAGVDGLTARSTEPFSLLGVSWDDPSRAPGTVEVRTRSLTTGRWSDWRALTADSEDRPDAAGSRGSTAPLWVGASDGVAVRVTGGARTAGLRAELVDPGRGPARRAAGGDGIVSRAQWGADESLREPEPGYTGPVRVVFVHHTDTGNDYSCSDAPSLIRAIYQYHVKTNGWRDIGYNFLVDRCGTVYEGRAGGIDKPVLGAHTLGFNTDSAGIAALGTYVSTPAPQAQTDAIARTAAWKLSLAGHTPAETATLTSASDGSRYKKGTQATFDAISGHRDAFNTECPGDALYAALPSMR
ncbi:peptidoglycan recognition protein [Kitasatospora sp. NPDC002227]|uniref:peptidoglycan recognition protein family protein n=1 Tax=Kitasatospora sp. NPDC002227 TaxID=3154773 RepID=UPI003317458A